MNQILFKQKASCSPFEIHYFESLNFFLVQRNYPKSSKRNCLTLRVFQACLEILGKWPKTICQDFGEFHQAKKCFECELSIRLKKQGRKHVDIAANNGNLGNIRLGLGDLEKEESYYDRALV